MQKFGLMVGRFKNDSQGAVAVIFALSCVALMLIAGIAVDTARYHDLSARMQQALDGASLAAAKLLPDPNVTDAEIRERALAYFNAAIPTFGVKPSEVGTPNVVIDRTNASVEVSGLLKVPALFGGLAELPSLKVLNQKSKVVFDMTKVELAMVLDVTGSMNQGNKLVDLKAAAKDVVDTLFDGALNDTAIKIALVPYSASVNAGEFAATVSPSNICPAKPAKGQVCIDAAGAPIDTCVVERTGTNAATDVAPIGADQLPNVTLATFPYYKCPQSTIVPLLDRSERNTLKTILDGYIAEGRTAGHIGAAWGWYMLSPNWASVFPPESAPGGYSDKSVQKNMIIMTDGEFNTSYALGAAYANDDAAQITNSYAQFDTLCTEIKSKGITVYTVGFNLNVPEALTHLETCASSPASFFDAKTGAQLKDAFKAIAEKLGNLRVAS